MGFPVKAEGIRRAWHQTYPSAARRLVPAPCSTVWPHAYRVVRGGVLHRFASLGNKPRDVIGFGRGQQMIEEAAGG